MSGWGIILEGLKKDDDEGADNLLLFYLSREALHSLGQVLIFLLDPSIITGAFQRCTPIRLKDAKQSN